MSAIVVIVEVLVVWAITDFLTGVFHWLEDAYGHPTWPVVGRYVTKPNILHHYVPRAFVHSSWYISSRLLLVIGAAIVAVTAAAGAFTWQVALVVALGVNANQIHKCSHRSRRENGPVVTMLQRLRLIQSPSHHHRHHQHGRNSHYCVLTNFLNPVLDGVGFWRGAEGVIHHVFGVARRDDETMAREVLQDDPGFFGEHLATVQQQVARHRAG